MIMISIPSAGPSHVSSAKWKKEAGGHYSEEAHDDVARLVLAGVQNSEIQAQTGIQSSTFVGWRKYKKARKELWAKDKAVREEHAAARESAR
jgi:hypothetical protein